MIHRVVGQELEKHTCDSEVSCRPHRRITQDVPSATSDSASNDRSTFRQISFLPPSPLPDSRPRLCAAQRALLPRESSLTSLSSKGSSSAWTDSIEAMAAGGRKGSSGVRRGRRK